MRLLGAIIETFTGIFAIILSFLMAKDVLGWLGVGLNCVLFPLSAWVAPFYFGFKNSEWIYVYVFLGGLFGGGLLISIARSKNITSLKKDDYL